MNELYNKTAHNIVRESLNQQITWITLNVNNRDYTAFIDNNLPTPTVLQHHNMGYKLSWAIKGYLGTQKTKQYFLDTSKKLALLFEDCSVDEIEAKVNAYSKVCKALYDLKDFSDIEDRRKTKQFVQRQRKTNASVSCEDEIFELARFKCYDLKLENSLTYESVFNVFYTINLKYNMGKDKDIKYKAKNVYRWVEKHYNPVHKTKEEQVTAKRNASRKYNNKIKRTKLNTGEELMTRSENAKLQTKNKIDRNKAKIVGAIESLTFLKQKVTGLALAEYTGISRQTCSKYLKEIRAEKA